MKEGEAGRKIVVYRWEEGKLWKVKTKGKKRKKKGLYLQMGRRKGGMKEK